MHHLSKTIPLALSLLGITGLANASTYSFTDATTALVSELSTTTNSISYSGLDSAIVSASLKINISDDISSTFTTANGFDNDYVDLPVEYAKLTVGGTSYTSTEIDGNGVTVIVPVSPFPTITVDQISLGGTYTTLPVTVTGTPNPVLGTVGEYFNIDVTSLLSGVSGSLSYDLTAENIIAAFPAGIGAYIEDYNYNSAELLIETINTGGAVVPVPAAIWFMGTGLGLLGLSRKRA